MTFLQKNMRLVFRGGHQQKRSPLFKRKPNFSIKLLGFGLKHYISLHYAFFSSFFDAFM